MLDFNGTLILLLISAAIFSFPYLLWWIDYKAFGGKLWKFMENPPNDICTFLVAIPSFVYWSIMGITFMILFILLFTQVCGLLNISPQPYS